MVVGTKRVDQQAGYRAEPTDGTERGEVGYRPNHVDEVVVRNQLKFLAGHLVLAVQGYEISSIGQVRLRQFA